MHCREPAKEVKGDEIDTAKEIVDHIVNTVEEVKDDQVHIAEEVIKDKPNSTDEVMEDKAETDEQLTNGCFDGQSMDDTSVNCLTENTTLLEMSRIDLGDIGKWPAEITHETRSFLIQQGPSAIQNLDYDFLEVSRQGTSTKGIKGNLSRK